MFDWITFGQNHKVQLKGGGLINVTIDKSY